MKRNATSTAHPRARRNAGGPATRAALIASARRLFGRRGYDGTSVRAITHEARANLGAVTYHFGSKQGLYEAVLEHVLSPLAARVASAVARPGASLDRIEWIVRAFFEHLEENQDMPHLMLQEIAAGKTPPPPVVRVLGTVAGHLTALMREGQAAGEIRDGDPILMALSVISQPVHLTVTRRFQKAIGGLDQSDPATHDRVVEHAARFARAGLTAVGGDSRKGARR